MSIRTLDHAGWCCFITTVYSRSIESTADLSKDLCDITIISAGKKHLHLSHKQPRRLGAPQPQIHLFHNSSHPAWGHRLTEWDWSSAAASRRRTSFNHHLPLPVQPVCHLGLSCNYLWSRFQSFLPSKDKASSATFLLNDSLVSTHRIATRVKKSSSCYLFSSRSVH